MSIKASKELKKMNKGRLTFGQMLYALRISDEVTQSELARTLGVSRGLICDIEKHRREPSIDLAIQIAQALGYPKQMFVQKIFEDQLSQANLKLKVKLEAA